MKNLLLIMLGALLMLPALARDFTDEYEGHTHFKNIEEYNPAGIDERLSPILMKIPLTKSTISTA